jgi:hypothetical protein
MRKPHYIPLRFGILPGAPWRIPVGGDPVSAAVARVQHELVLRHRDVRTHGSGRQNARAFGIFQSVWTCALARKGSWADRHGRPAARLHGW